MVRKAIIELYLNVKIRSQQEIQAMNEEAMDDERKKLNRVDTVDIIDYIKQSVEILMHMRLEEFEQFQSNWNQQEALRKAKLKEERERLKEKIKDKNRSRSRQTKLFDKVKCELLSSTSQASLRNEDKTQIDKEVAGYEKMLVKLEGDIR